MAVAKEQIRQIISENNINSVADILTGMGSAFRYLMKMVNRKSGQETENNGNGF